MHIKRQFLRTALAWGGLLAFMALFQPSKLPVVLLIVPFVLLFAAFYTLWNLLNLLRVRYFARQTWQPSRRLGVAVCLTGVLLMVLQSLGQLTLRDVLTILALLLLGYAYVARNVSRAPRE